MWEGLSAFEHAQCTLLARGLPLVKLPLPCSLSPLFLPWLAVLLCSIFLVCLICSVDASKAFSLGPHLVRYFSLLWACCSGSLAAHTGAMSLSSGTLSSSGTVPSTAGVCRGRSGRGRTVVILSAPWNERTPPPADEFVPSRDGVLALIQDELQALQCQLILENLPLPMPSVAGGPQSGELPL